MKLRLILYFVLLGVIFDVLAAARRRSKRSHSHSHSHKKKHRNSSNLRKGRQDPYGNQNDSNYMVYPELGYLDETTYYAPHKNPLYPGGYYATPLTYGNGYTYKPSQPITNVGDPVIKPKPPTYHRFHR